MSVCTQSSTQHCIVTSRWGCSNQEGSERGCSLGSREGKSSKIGRIGTGLGPEWELGTIAIVQFCFSFTFPEKKGQFI